MNKLKQLFQTPSGGFPKIYFVLPIGLWLLGTLVYLLMTIKKETVSNHIQAASMAVGLQEDINYISTKTKASEVFSLSKKEMIKAEKNQNFLMAKAKRKLDKSVFAESMGSNDENLAGFDSELSPIMGDPALSNDASIDSMAMDSIAATDEVDFLMQQAKKSKYHQLEEERKQRLAAAKLDNRRKREALDKSTLSVEAAAYQKGLADSQAQYSAYNGQPATDNQSSQKSGLTFSTVIGTKDDLALNVKKVPISMKGFTAVPSITMEQKAIKAVIDQKQKFRSGDKIQLRVLEEGIYQGQIVKANTLLYGLCSITANRLFVSIASIPIDGRVVPATLSVYDLDGIAGIYIDGAYQDATKQAINQGLNDAGNLGLRSTLGNLSIKLGRKANQKLTAFLPAGYTVLVYDTQKL